MRPVVWKIGSANSPRANDLTLYDIPLYGVSLFSTIPVPVWTKPAKDSTVWGPVPPRFTASIAYDQGLFGTFLYGALSNRTWINPTDLEGSV